MLGIIIIMVFNCVDKYMHIS